MEVSIAVMSNMHALHRRKLCVTFMLILKMITSDTGMVDTQRRPIAKHDDDRRFICRANI